MQHTRPVFLGVDLGGTKVAFARGGPDGVEATHRRPTAPSGDPREDVDRLIDDLRALRRDAGDAPITGVGVSVPAPFDPETGTVLKPPNLPGWHEVPLRGWLEDALGCPVWLENDANAAALAEWSFGAGKGARHMVYLTMSTGVGGGLILDGRLYRGRRAGAGEVGHVPVEWEGELCGCGLRGCAEAYLGGACWQRRLRECTPADSRVAALAGGVGQVTPREVVAAAREADPFALEEMARFNHYLAQLLAAVVFCYAPERIVLGTIVVAAGDTLCLDPVRRLLAERCWPQLTEGLQLLPAGLGDALPAHAGLCVALEGLEAQGR